MLYISLFHFWGSYDKILRGQEDNPMTPSRLTSTEDTNIFKEVETISRCLLIISSVVCKAVQLLV